MPEQTQTEQTQTEQIAEFAPEVTPPQESVSEPEQAQVSEPTPPVAYSELPTPLNFVTNKAPTSVYDLDMDTFANITAVKELAEGTPFTAVSKAEVVNASETMTYYVDAQSLSINSDDLSPAPEESANSSVSDSASQDESAALDDNTNEKAPEYAAQPDLNKIFNYKDFPDGPKLFSAVGTTHIDDLNPVNPKPEETLLDNDPIWIQGAFTDPKSGINYYRSDKSVANGDWYAIPINAVTHDNETDHLSSQVIDMSKKQKMLNRVGAIAGTPVGLIRDIYFKSKKG